MYLTVILTFFSLVVTFSLMVTLEQCYKFDMCLEKHKLFFSQWWPKFDTPWSQNFFYNLKLEVLKTFLKGSLSSILSVWTGENNRKKS